MLLYGMFMRFTRVETTSATSRSAIDTTDSSCSKATPARLAKTSGMAGMVDRSKMSSWFLEACIDSNTEICRKLLPAEARAELIGPVQTVEGPMRI